jgi:hypothetical protein
MTGFLMMLMTFVFGGVVGYLSRDIFWLNEDKDENNEGYPGIAVDFTKCEIDLAKANLANSDLEELLAQEKERVRRLIIENAQHRMRLDGQFSDKEYYEHKL